MAISDKRQALIEAIASTFSSVDADRDNTYSSEEVKSALSTLSDEIVDYLRSTGQVQGGKNTSVAFGGIRKGSTILSMDFYSTAIQNIWNALNSKPDKDHKHKMSDVNSGILQLSQGGTGVTNTSVNANLVFAGPSSGSSSGNASWRKLVASDIPSLDGSKITGTLSAALNTSGDAKAANLVASNKITAKDATITNAISSKSYQLSEGSSPVNFYKNIQGLPDYFGIQSGLTPEISLNTSSSYKSYVIDFNGGNFRTRFTAEPYLAVTPVLGSWGTSTDDGNKLSKISIVIRAITTASAEIYLYNPDKVAIPGIHLEWIAIGQSEWK